MSRYNIYVTLKQVVYDPAGKAAENAIADLGYKGLESLRIGKFIEIKADEQLDISDVEEICARLLSNPVIEDFKIDIIAD